MVLEENRDIGLRDISLIAETTKVDRPPLEMELLLAAAEDGALPAGLEGDAKPWLRDFWAEREALWEESSWLLWGETALAGARAAGVLARLLVTARSGPNGPVTSDDLCWAHNLLGALQTPGFENQADPEAAIRDVHGLVRRPAPGNTSTMLPPADDHALLVRLAGEVEIGAAMDFGDGCHWALAEFCRLDSRGALYTREGWDVLGASWLLGGQLAGALARLLEARGGNYQRLERRHLRTALELVGLLVPSMRGDWHAGRIVRTVCCVLDRERQTG